MFQDQSAESSHFLQLLEKLSFFSQLKIIGCYLFHHDLLLSALSSGVVSYLEVGKVIAANKLVWRFNAFLNLTIMLKPSIVQLRARADFHDLYFLLECPVDLYHLPSMSSGFK